MIQVVHQTRAYCCFLLMKQLGVFLLPAGWDASPLYYRVTPSIKFTGTQLYTWVERDSMRVKCHCQEYNTVAQAGFKPWPVDPEFSILTILVWPSLPCKWCFVLIFFLKAHVGPRRIARWGIVFIYENLAILRVWVLQSTSILGFLAWVVIPLFYESSSTI